MNITITVNYNFDKLYNALSASTQIPQIAKAYEAWATIYRAAMQERFVVNSRGAGSWPALSKRTLEQRRKKGKSAAILRDTGLLFGTLNPTFGQPGQHQQLFDNGIEIGFSDTARYSDGSSLADIAAKHQYGTWNIPQRTIFVQPSDKTKSIMSKVMEKALEDVINV